MTFEQRPEESESELWRYEEREFPVKGTMSAKALREGSRHKEANVAEAEWVKRDKNEVRGVARGLSCKPLIVRTWFLF